MADRDDDDRQAREDEGEEELDETVSAAPNHYYNS